MGDNRTVPLQYGHLGDVRYLPDEQTWEFSRKIDRRPYLTPFDHHDEVFPSSEKQECSVIDEAPISSHVTPDKESVLRNNCPQLAPGLQLLHDLNTPSSVLEHIAATWNPQVSATISVGNTISGYSSRTSLVAGFVSSNLPNVVQIVSPRMRSIEWCARRITIPVMAGGDKAIFAENRGRIYQITLAESLDEKSTFMAVRYAKSTAVFRPVRHTKPVAPSHADEESPTGLELEPTRLDANPIVEIPVSSTGEASHADIAFNPWYQQELAVIDSQGNWSIWDISPWLSHRNIWRGRCSKSGSINSEHKDDSSFAEKPDAHDAWARIMWVGDVHRLLVFGRRRIVVVNLADEIQYHSVDLKFHRGSEWILDVFRSPSHMSDVFLLTTLRIVWLSSATDGFAASQTRDEPQIKILLEWYHYRDAEDVSLRLAPLQVGSEFALVLYSQMNPLAQIFRFAYSTNDASIPVSVSDPSTLHLPSRGADSEGRIEGRDHDVYSTLIFQEVDGSSVDDSFDTSGSLRLIKLLAQRADNSLVESLYVARTTKDEDYPEYDLFSQQKRVREDRYPLSTRDIGGNFVVQDWYEQPVPLPRHDQISFVKQIEDIMFPSITDFSRLYAFLLRDVMISGSEENRMLLENVNTSFDNPSDLQVLFANATTALTLHDLLKNSDFHMDNFEMGAEAFEALLSLVQKSGRSTSLHLDINYLPLPYTFHSSFSSQVFGVFGSHMVYDTYNVLVQDYISSLCQTISVSHRISKERLIRIVMVELLLSQIVLSWQPPAIELVERENETTLAETQPLGGSLSLSSDPSQDSQDPKASSITSGSKSPLSTLVRYTRLNNNQPLTSQINAVLSHWKVGNDPATYDWQKASHYARENEATQGRSRKPQDRRKYRPKRKERQDYVEDAISLSSSQIVPAVRGSSRRDALKREISHTVRSSQGDNPQQAPTSSKAYPPTSRLSASQSQQQLSMTQEERGLFGSRESRKKTNQARLRKKRAAGF